MRAKAARRSVPETDDVANRDKELGLERALAEVEELMARRAAPSPGAARAQEGPTNLEGRRRLGEDGH